MMNRKTGYLGKGLLLLAGIGLSGLVVMEASQQMVRALDLNGVSSQTHNDRHPQLIPPNSGTPPADRLANSRIAPAQPSSGKANPAHSATALDFGVDTAPSQPETLALNAGAANQPQQPISQISSAQVAAAASAWHGASFPVENFQAYTSPFGYRSSPSGGYSQEFHYGLDMAAPEGSYVRNWWSGKVVEVSDNSNCGTSVVVESGNWTHIYCHMEGHVEKDDRGLSMIDREGGIQIYEGQQVTAGSRIGRVGMSGRTTGPHLHWGLKYDGNWVDPAYVLQAMYASQESATQVTSDRVQ
ncbi:MAG TPA: M23 family metallopeptidase [Coleofasciculaceae cyanobacterium]